MRDMTFFQEIEHVEVPWGERSIWSPVFYYEIMSMSVQFLAPTDGVKALLPSPRLHPLRVMPGQSVVNLTLFRYRDCDIGPYNEVSFGIPVTLDKATPLLTGLLWPMPSPLMIYSRHLPVSTEIARAAGAEFAGYPKFVADIEFQQEDGWTTCQASENGQHILTFSGRELPLKQAPRRRLHIFTQRNGRLLRCEMITSEQAQGASARRADLRLQLGDHPMGREIAELPLGRLVGYQWSPKYQAVLTQVVESLPV